MAGHVGRLSSRRDWAARAEAWDAECFRLEDLARLEAIRTGHHQQVADRVTTSRLDAKPEPVDQWEAIARELAGTFSPA